MLVPTCNIEIQSPLEKLWQGSLQDGHKFLHLLCDSYQVVVVDQVELGLLQGPLAARFPADTEQSTNS